MKRVRSVALLCGLVCLSTTFTSTAASPRVPIKLTVAWGSQELSEPQVLVRHSCYLMAVAGSNGVGILQAAKLEQCISSYSTYRWPPGHDTYLECIERDCSMGGTAPRDWYLYENGKVATYWGDLHALHVDANDNFLFSLVLICCYG